MKNTYDQDRLSFAEEAFLAFNEIMSKRHKSMFDDVNRANKGELFVLQFLEMQEREVLPSELSVALQASTARISALLGALEKKGQIARNIDETNRRNILVTLTAPGRERVETEMKRIKTNMTNVFAAMGEADTNEFLRLTYKFSDLMQTHMSKEETNPL